MLHNQQNVFLLLCSRPSAELTMRLHEMPSLLSVSYQFHRCFNVYIFAPQIFFHVVNPRFPLSSSASHAFDVACSPPCLVWECIIFHPFHVTEPCKSSFLDLSIIVSSCSITFLTVLFLTFCSLARDSRYFSEPSHF